MSLFESLASETVGVAALIGERAEFDGSAAELIARNAAVAADRLTPRTFLRLSPDSARLVLEAASAARELAPLDPVDEEPLPTETPEERDYRVRVWQPLHSLQSRINAREFDSADEREVGRLKNAVQLGSRAFAAILSEADRLPIIAETERYFWGNTMAAARRLNRR